MISRVSLITVTALSLTPVGLSQPAAADGYQEERVERDIARDRRELRDERRERNYDAYREHRALEHGRWWGARYWDWRRRHEQGDVNADRRDIHRDYESLERDRY